MCVCVCIYIYVCVYICVCVCIKAVLEFFRLAMSRCPICLRYVYAYLDIYIAIYIYIIYIYGCIYVCVCVSKPCSSSFGSQRPGALYVYDMYMHI